MRVFTAVEIPEGIKDNLLNASALFDGKGITLVKKDALHITLQFLGERREDEIEEIKKDIESIDEPAFNVSFKGLSYFEHNHPSVIFAKVVNGRQNLINIYNKLSSTILEKEGEYTPHATIARVRYAKDNLALISKIKGHENDDFGSYGVVSILLKKSTLTQDGPVYKDLYEKKL